ncbi:MAG: VWA domain-containing protein [Rhodothermaceae bacterium]|nr:VWA domain-containing protein [Rhodothermaceae bacterium]MXZ57345.1 VWA domain-containing protein [Rhodothermaceae bacterium]MYB90616.1 VWA domain-containing protein [Rhodothermaceae bacterium]MYD68364.1 VWA domain-containing protein [Rhodothermaceae bacterium]MYG44353.1 VWA domain-containing protein [Rhodothermaceae bacterium]
MTKNTSSSDTPTADLLQFPHFPERRRHDDPFADLVHGDSVTNDAPLIKLDFHVTIRGGLAFVKAKRTYINKTDGPIEAVMSLPVSVHAAFFGLSAVIDGKHYDAQAKPKQEALETYEEAIDQGKATVLHEELLKGIHSLSVGNLGAGKTVTATTRWAESLRFHDGSGQLRIPLTVGDVYGISPLEDVDTLTVGGPVPEATIHMQHDAESVELAGGNLCHAEGEVYFAKIPGNAPIELKVTGTVSSELTGVSRDGRPVTLQISPHNKQWTPLNAAVLVDRSGSMGAKCTYSGNSSETQHEAVVRSLREMQPLLIDGDRLALWEFDTDCDRVGEFNCNNPEEFRRLLASLGDPRGGTSIGSALEQVCASEEGRDILLITDGQSYDLDVQRIAKSGHRIFVVLVGEGSLEATVGHLAVLSGGDIHFSFGADVDQAIQACIQGMRQKPDQGARCDLDELGLPERVETTHNNASIEASWSQQAENPEVSGEFSEAVAAYAASLAFAGAEEKWAENIAVQAGLVTHLTSLVLVAEDAQIQEELPRTIKQALPVSRGVKFYGTPSTVAYASASAPGIYHSTPAGRMAFDEPKSYAAPEVSVGKQIRALLGEDLIKSPLMSSPSINWDTVVWLGRQVDWNSAGPELVQGHFEEIPEEIAKGIVNLVDEVAQFAEQFGMSSHIFVIALAAYAVQESSKWAGRVYRRIIRDCDQGEFESFALDLHYAR